MCKDIYFEPNYARLYCISAGNSVEEFVYEDNLGRITNLFLKRTIEIEGFEKGWYDIISPYGYGGPIIQNLSNEANKDELIGRYIGAFSKYVEDQHIVSEFVRFHPLMGNGADFRNVLNVSWSRQTVGTNLDYADVFQTEVDKRTRKKIRHILSNPNISYVLDEHPVDLVDFMTIYYATMDRNSAESQYYFDSTYFKNLLTFFPDNLLTIKVLLEDKTIAMGLCFRYNQMLHVHLSGTLSEYLSYSPAYILRYALILYGKEHGFRMIHHGGGRSSNPDDTLFGFKKHFGKNTLFDFYVGKNIWNMDVYKELCNLTGNDLDTTFFPAYRAGGVIHP